jgi:hypothetical protein
VAQALNPQEVILAAATRPQVQLRPELRNELEELYYEYRRAALNKVYYGARLARQRQINRAVEIIIAVGSTTGSGGIAGMAIWGTLPGQYAWLVISGIATVLAVVKPRLQLTIRVENYSKLFVGYTNLQTELEEIVREVRISHELSEKAKDQHRRSRKLFKQLALRHDPTTSRRLTEIAQQQVNKDIRPESLWLPDVGT